MADAEDAVQETYLRWHGADRANVSDPRAFLMTTTTRICLDMLTSARARREEYVGPWLPEPVLDTAALAPDSRTELAEDLSIALLLTLDRLPPLERAAFLLHDVFDFSFSEVATALERSEAACRQLAARARGHVRVVRPRGATVPPARSGGIDAKHAQLMSAFMAATQAGDLNALTCVDGAVAFFFWCGESVFAGTGDEITTSRVERSGGTPSGTPLLTASGHVRGPSQSGRHRENPRAARRSS
jgi:RNA polymerase sigma-70 factor (ECF subfamily)